MQHSSALPSQEQFDKWLHDAYGHLYDSPYLQSHPLCELLVRVEIVDPIQRSQALRRALLTAIETLRPQPGTPAQSPDWRYYRILEQRYIEALSPVEVMQQLALGKSQFYRDQAYGFGLLAERLWQQYQPPPANDQPPDMGAREVAVESEAQRYLRTADWKLIHLAELLENLQPVFAPLIEIHGVALRYDALYNLPPVRADRVMLRQTLINVLTCALTNAQDEMLEARPRLDASVVGFQLEYSPHPAAEMGGEHQKTSERLTLAAQFMEVMGGKLQTEFDGKRQRVALLWPHNRQKVLLVIDDNQGLVSLFKRYLANEPWQIVTAQSGAEALALIDNVTPSLILLDIMMPEQDGWEVLVALKQHPVTAAVPVLICSVVHEAQLADSLGAAGYVTKPVTQESLVTALRPWR